MKTQKALITIYDLTRLGRFAVDTNGEGAYADTYLRRKLREFLDGAEVIRPWHVSSDVVTMNSTVRLRNCRNNEEMTFRLIFPGGADPDGVSLSVLTQMGIAVLGRKIGHVILGHFRIEEVLYQPEAAKDFHL